MWQWFCIHDESYALFFHVVPQKFYPGDLIFPVFLFASGASLWLYIFKLKRKRQSLVEAERKYLSLLLLGFFFSGLKFFSIFPDEVMIIALLGILSLNLFWAFGRTGVYLAAVALSLFFLWLWVWSPGIIFQYYFKMLGGELGFAYFAIIYLVGFAVSSYAFPSAVPNSASLKKLSLLLLHIAFLAFFFSLLWPIERLSLSPSFLALSLSVSLLILTILVLLCDLWGFKSDFFVLLGQNSIWGWGLLSISLPISFVFNLKVAMPVWLYLLCCIALIFLLYAALAKFVKKKS
ncbi:MAG: hypothetical protein QXT25_04310 [Candidatus Anstonellaceae archaeon]